MKNSASDITHSIFRWFSIASIVLWLLGYAPFAYFSFQNKGNFYVAEYLTTLSWLIIPPLLMILVTWSVYTKRTFVFISGAVGFVTLLLSACLLALKIIKVTGSESDLFVPSISLICFVISISIIEIRKIIKLKRQPEGDEEGNRLFRKFRYAGLAILIIIIAAVGVDRLSVVIWRYRINNCYHMLQSMSGINAQPFISHGIAEIAEQRFGFAFGVGGNPMEDKKVDNGYYIGSELMYEYLAALNCGPMPRWLLVRRSHIEGEIRSIYSPPRLVWSTWLMAELVDAPPQEYQLLIHVPVGEVQWDDPISPNVKLVETLGDGQSKPAMPPLIHGKTEAPKKDESIAQVKKIVEPFIKAVKTLDPAHIADFISYPLSRQYPIPPIKNRQEFLERFDEVFDNKLIKNVTESNLDRDWSTVGWRGIMFENGNLWLDYDGKVKTVNYLTQHEKNIWRKLVESKKSQLYKGLRDFKKPVLEWKTKSFQIRIDDMGDNGYRYASWKLPAPESSRPELVIEGGTRTTDGSGGNHHYTFTNGEYRYVCTINVMTGELPPRTLEIYKDGKLIFDSSEEK